MSYREKDHKNKSKQVLNRGRKIEILDVVYYIMP